MAYDRRVLQRSVAPVVAMLHQHMQALLQKKNVLPLFYLDICTADLMTKLSMPFAFLGTSFYRSEIFLLSPHNFPCLNYSVLYRFLCFGLCSPLHFLITCFYLV